MSNLIELRRTLKTFLCLGYPSEKTINRLIWAIRDKKEMNNIQMTETTVEVKPEKSAKKYFQYLSKVTSALSIDAKFNSLLSAANQQVITDNRLEEVWNGHECGLCIRADWNGEVAYTMLIEDGRTQTTYFALRDLPELLDVDIERAIACFIRINSQTPPR